MKSRARIFLAIFKPPTSHWPGDWNYQWFVCDQVVFILFKIIFRMWCDPPGGHRAPLALLITTLLAFTNGKSEVKMILVSLSRTKKKWCYSLSSDVYGSCAKSHSLSPTHSRWDSSGSIPRSRNVAYKFRHATIIHIPKNSSIRVQKFPVSSFLFCLSCKYKLCSEIFKFLNWWIRGILVFMSRSWAGIFKNYLEKVGILFLS